ncbi:YpbS family protein [Rossellomorea vietnamensis]|uniref:YpbS family protein n=1 Tax=Rossellomorea vietnamensis TaxID=218284 RepID=UPI003CF5546F
MNVHKAITNHSKKQNAIAKEFIKLDQQREYYIEEAVSLCLKGDPFTTDKINEITKRINDEARLGIVPERKLVTAQMVEEYCASLTKK